MSARNLNSVLIVLQLIIDFDYLLKHFLKNNLIICIDFFLINEMLRLLSIKIHQKIVLYLGLIKKYLLLINSIFLFANLIVFLLNLLVIIITNQLSFFINLFLLIQLLFNNLIIELNILNILVVSSGLNIFIVLFNFDFC